MNKESESGVMPLLFYCGEQMNEILAKRLRLARKAQKISAEVLAKKLYYTGASILHYEQGRTVPAVDVVEQIAKELGVSPAWLCGWEKDEQK